MNLTKLIDLKERIAVSDAFTPAERDFLLDAINAAVPRPTIAHNPPNYLGRIDAIWAALSVDDGGEGVCAAPIGGMTLPLIAADAERLTVIRPLCRELAKVFCKPVRLVKFTTREDLEIFR
jgi:hypothetical protein